MESDAVVAMSEKLDPTIFARACQLMLEVDGRVIVTGMGKSGHIANKIAATLASTGTPAFYVHPAEASHGDMGMITEKDVVLALSNSGSTPEVVTLLPLLKRLGVALISMTGNPASPLALASDAHIDTGVETEACPLDLAPTSSTTTSLVMGDALAIALLEARGFTAEEFAFSHPGGALGRKLLMLVEDVMIGGEEVPRVTPQSTLAEALMEITAKGLGMTTVVDAHDQLLGIFTDGDLRRALEHRPDVNSDQIDRYMSRGGKSATPHQLAAEALTEMENHSISTLVVLDEQQRVCGVVSMLALLRAGIA